MLELYNTLVDYLTITTFNEYAKEWIVRVIEGSVNKEGDSYEVMRRGSYSGWKYETSGIFVGSTNQKNKENGHLCNHYMIVASGSIANNLYRRLHYEEGIREYRDVIKCSRIDVQKTVHEDFNIDKTGIDIEQMARVILLSDATAWPNTRPSRAYFEGCTIYLGKREGEEFRRIYLKEGADAKLYRYEVEYKGAKAQQVFREPSLMEARYLASWNNVPVGIDLRWLGNTCVDPCFEKEKSSLAKKRDWLEDTVHSAVMKDATGVFIENNDMEALMNTCMQNILWFYDVLIQKEKTAERELIERMSAKSVSRETGYC